MRHAPAALVLLLLFLHSRAQEEPAKPDAPEQAAENVLASVEAEDERALKSLAEKDDPDPWLVADELCMRGEHEAALAFAKAAPRKDTEKLPEYVASRKPGSDEAARRVLELVKEAREAGDPRAALAALEAAGSVPPGVVSVRLLEARGHVLREVRQLGPSAAAFHRAANEAESLGWLCAAAGLLFESGLSAQYWADYRSAVSRYEEWLAVERRRGCRKGEAQALGTIGRVFVHVGAYARALEYQKRSHAIREELGDPEELSKVFVGFGITYEHLGDLGKALEYLERALRMREDLGDRAAVAGVLGNLGNVHNKTGDYAKAIECQERSLAINEEMGELSEVATNLLNLGAVHIRLGDHPKALECQERSLKLFEALGHRSGVATCLFNIGRIHRHLGAYPQALDYMERARALHEEHGDRSGAAAALVAMGAVRGDLGDYAAAFATLEEALKNCRDAGDRVGEVAALASLGTLHQSLRDLPKALEYLERTLPLMERLGMRQGVLGCLVNLGSLHKDLGDHRKALGCLERALGMCEGRGDRTTVAWALVNIGIIHGHRRDYTEALKHFQRALVISEELGDLAGTAKILGSIGIARGSLGEYAEAVAFQERSLELIEELGRSPVMALWGLAHIHLEGGNPAAAADAARRCVSGLSRLANGVADEQGALVREGHAGAFDLGLHAGQMLRDAETVSFFLESGRAGALLENLGGRDRLRAALVPEDLRREVDRARAAETVATRLLARAYDRGKRRACRQRRKELEAAREEVREAVQRVQRSARASADLLYHEADDLSEIRGRVRAGEALLLYGLTVKGALCLVVEKRGARLVTLARADQVLEAARAFAPEDPGAETEEAAATLRRLLVEPLGLSARVNRVFVSPQGALSYLPFSLLLGPREVTYVPSGTTYGVLLEEGEKRGEGVLALGDPDYAGMRLPRLPATRAEAKTVGDEVLLGKDASERGLAEALSGRTRWRAVHFACHGLVDPERPTLSCLALSRDAESDGRLTCLEVFRGKVSADLVVLSACETAKGKVYRAEGIVGLTRAFMMAGAPRVLCSLWKVDDEATRTLMVKFYELWNPEEGEGLPAATALKQAQEYVRNHERWKHPFYWAAWVLWGLPD